MEETKRVSQLCGRSSFSSHMWAAALLTAGGMAGIIQLESFLCVSKQIIMHWLNIFSYLFLRLDHGPYGETW